MSGYVPFRRALVVEHAAAGNISCCELGAYTVGISLADKQTGIWFGSAKALAGCFGAGDISERAARHLLESLEKKGYIKRFTIRRAHGNYPIAINRYEPTFGAKKGMRLNASKTIDWRNPVYDFCQEPGAEGGAQPGAEPAPSLEGEERKRRRKKKSAATADAAQPVAFSSALLIVSQVQDTKLADTYPWVDRPREYKKMALWLEANRPGSKVRNPLAFCQNWFNKIPCPANSLGAKQNAKTIDPDQRTSDNLRAAGVLN